MLEIHIDVYKKDIGKSQLESTSSPSELAVFNFWEHGSGSFSTVQVEQST